MVFRGYSYDGVTTYAYADSTFVPAVVETRPEEGVMLDDDGLSRRVLAERRNLGPSDFDLGCELDEHGVHYEGAADNFITKLVCVEPTADFDADGDVDLRDFAAFQNCFTGQAPVECGPGCSLLDLDPDDDIDLDDYAAFGLAPASP